jgi:serine/threonine-protein kinase
MEDPTALGAAEGQATAPNRTLAAAATNDDKTAVGSANSLSEMELERPSGKQVLLGDYEVTRRLGAGGMGVVYKARQVSLDRDVALKVLFKDLAASRPDFVSRFYREAKVMAKLNHPNVVTCYGVGEAHGLHYLAMEFVEGGSVAHLIKQNGRLNLGDAVHITLACLYALQHAHELNLVHRDVKPDNLLLTSKGVVKLADLGLAKALDDDMSLTQSGLGAGTPHYMSPEQAKSAKHVDARTDIYAVGCMLYRFLTGKVPFNGDTVVELFMAKTKGTFPSARKLNAEIPDRLDLLIDRMLATKVELRPKSCTEVAAELEALAVANEQLSFFGGGAAVKSLVPKLKSSPPTVRMDAAATTKSGDKSSPDARKDAPASDYWYVKAGKKGSKTVVQKLTRDQILSRLREEKLSPSVEVSRDFRSGYRALGSYPEFEYFARSRLQKAKADRRATKIKSFYENLETEERRYKRWKWIKRWTGSAMGLLLLLTVLALVIGGAFLVVWKWADIVKLFK